MARNELFAHARSNITKIAILVTDGRANRDPLATIPEANKTKAEGVEVFTIGITDDVRRLTHTHTCTHTRTHATV